jgi:hypothetical protein
MHCRRATESLDPSYSFVDYDSLGFGMWGLGDDHKSAPFKPQPEPKQNKPKLPALSVVEANLEFKRLARQWGLSYAHRQKLKRERELTPEQIEQAHQLGWLFTWQGGSRCNPGLPGATLEGKTREFRGFAIGAPNPAGDITGAQIANDKPNPKYYWASSAKVDGNEPKSILGQNPIGCYHPLDDRKPEGVILCEGLLKPLIAAQVHGYITIGAAGGDFGSSNRLLKQYLEELLPQTSSQRIIVAPDDGCLDDKQVLGKLETLLNLLDQFGYSYEIGGWGQW